MTEDKQRDHDIRRMADLLREGATIVELACPACASPLFRLGSNDLWCASCEKRVIVVKEGEEPRLANSLILDELETTLLSKVREIEEKLQHEQSAEELQKLGVALAGILENLEKTRRAKKA